MLAEQKGDLELRADAIRAGDEDGLFVLARIQRKQAAEAAEVAEDFRAICRAHAVLDELDGSIARIDVDARVLIGHFFCHSVLGFLQSK